MSGMMTDEVSERLRRLEEGLNYLLLAAPWYIEHKGRAVVNPAYPIPHRVEELEEPQ